MVDNVEAMIDEWYPGLRNFDVVTGKKLVTSGTLCPHCPVDRTPAHCFQLKDLEDKSYETDEVMCPIHKGTVLMEYLVIILIISMNILQSLYRHQTSLLMIWMTD